MKLKRFFTLIFKKNLLTFIFTLFLLLLILYSQANLFAAQNGLLLWAKNVVPSLFPFFIATELLNYTNLPYYLGKLTNKFMRPLFNVPGEGSYAFIMGIISGYPIGAKIVNRFIEDGTCTKQEAERLLAFTNNSSPLFIIGTVGISLFGDSAVGIILFITHILACLTVGLIFGLLSKKKSINSYTKEYCTHVTDYRNSLKYSQNHNNNLTVSKKNKYSWKRLYRSSNNTVNTASYSISDLGTILSTSITNAISTILLIGGFIVLFSIIISILNNLNIISSISTLFSYISVPTAYIQCILTGLLELTNGINAISSLHIKSMSIQIIISAFLLGFAGFSIFLQIFSIASKNNLSMKPYFIGKILQGLLAAFYTFIILYFFDFFYFNMITL